MTGETLARAIETLRAAPDRFASMTQGLAPAHVTRKPASRVFSILENIAHVNDIEREGYLVRFRRVMEEDTPFLPDIDGERLAIERRYNDRDLASELGAFAAARAEVVLLLEGISPSRLERAGELEKVGKVTLGKLVDMLIEHDRGHLEEIGRLKEGR